MKRGIDWLDWSLGFGTGVGLGLMLYALLSRVTVAVR